MPTQYTKEIIYDRVTRDYAMYLNDDLVGFARTYQEAESTLDELVYELLMQQPIVTPCGACGFVGCDCTVLPVEVR